MFTAEMVHEHASADRAIVAGTVQSIGEGTVLVGVEGSEIEPVPCDVLRVVHGTTSVPVAGDRVLVWHVQGAERGVVLGVITGPTVAAAVEQESSEAAESAPDTLVLEARENLTLRCGDGSITIRADGRILIKGKDLVSHARRTNRIRGGAVTVN